MLFSIKNRFRKNRFNEKNSDYIYVLHTSANIQGNDLIVCGIGTTLLIKRSLLYLKPEKRWKDK